jgi:predicted Zn-dependent peptidase
MHDLAEKWFGEIEDGTHPTMTLPKEPRQNEKRHTIIKADVPIRALYMAFHMPDRLHPAYYACDLLSDLLANGKSSRFYQKLVKKRQVFSHVDAYISGTFDPGLFIVDGKIMPDTSLSDAEGLVWDELEDLKKGNFSESELTKVKNKVTTEIILSNLDILNKAMMLAYFEAISDAQVANEQIEMYMKVNKEDIVTMANELLVEENMSELIYLPLSN